jgi:hypothetical protein
MEHDCVHQHLTKLYTIGSHCRRKPKDNTEYLTGRLYLLTFDDAVLLYPQRFALASPTSGGLSVGIVRSRTQVMKFVFVCFDDAVQ